MHFIAARPRASNSCAYCRSCSVISLGILFDLSWSGTIVSDGDANAHRLLTRVLLGDLGRQARNSADNKNQLSEWRRETHVEEHRGQRPVDVDGQRPDLPRNGIV